MKSKTWALILGAALVVCLGLSIFLLRPGRAAAKAEVYSDGKLVTAVDLAVDQTLTVEGTNGTNVVTVKDGKIAVTAADCPDHHCMARGFCHSGAAIVCLPNRLVIEFVGAQDVDGAIG